MTTTPMTEQDWYQQAEMALDRQGGGSVLKDWTDQSWETLRERGLHPEEAAAIQAEAEGSCPHCGGPTFQAYSHAQATMDPAANGWTTRHLVAFQVGSRDPLGPVECSAGQLGWGGLR